MVGEGIYNAELFHSDYKVYMGDRNYKLTGVTRGGGGVVLAVRTDFRVEQITFSDIADNDCDYLWLKIKLPNQIEKLHVAIFYFPPNKSNDICTYVRDILTLQMA